MNQLPFRQRRQIILDEIDNAGLFVNRKYRAQLKDRSCLKSRDITRMIKKGDVKLIRVGSPRSRYTQVVRV